MFRCKAKFFMFEMGAQVESVQRWSSHDLEIDDRGIRIVGRRFTAVSTDLEIEWSQISNFRLDGRFFWLRADNYVAGFWGSDVDQINWFAKKQLEDRLTTETRTRFPSNLPESVVVDGKNRLQRKVVIAVGVLVVILMVIDYGLQNKTTERYDSKTVSPKSIELSERERFCYEGGFELASGIRGNLLDLSVDADRYIGQDIEVISHAVIVAMDELKIVGFLGPTDNCWFNLNEATIKTNSALQFGLMTTWVELDDMRSAKRMFKKYTDSPISNGHFRFIGKVNYTSDMTPFIKVTSVEFVRLKPKKTFNPAPIVNDTHIPDISESKTEAGSAESDMTVSLNTITSRILNTLDRPKG